MIHAIHARWAKTLENLILLHGSSEDTDQPGHLDGLISIFVIGYLKRRITKHAIRQNFIILASLCSITGWF